MGWSDNRQYSRTYRHHRGAPRGAPRGALTGYNCVTPPFCNAAWHHKHVTEEDQLVFHNAGVSVSEVVKLPRTDGLHELSIQNLQQRPSKKLLPSLMNKGLPFKRMYKPEETAIVVHNSMRLTSLVTNQECTNLIQFCNWQRPSWSKLLTCQLLPSYVFARELIAPLSAP